MALSPTLRFRQFKGINNVDDPVRLHEGNKVSGLTSLVEAENVDIDSRRMLSRRDGMLAPRYVGVVHSIWSNENEDICFFVEGTELKQLFSDDTTAVVKTGLTPELEMSYVEVNNIVVITNNQFIGYIQDGAYKDFIDPDGRGKIRPIPGHLIETFQNKILVAVGSAIYFSDSMMLHNFDRRKNYHQFHGVISMIKAVKDGVYISDSKDTYFLAGGDFQKARADKVADYMSFNDGAIRLEGEELGLEGYSGKVIMWASEKGICVGADGGRFANITKLVYSPGSTWNRGAGLFRKDKKQYIVSLHN
jgi:hypothetical protein